MPLGPPPERVRTLNENAPNEAGTHVLYWMTAFRRTEHNFALDHAVRTAREAGVPLLVFEPLRAGYPHASARLHHFVIEGMRDNAAACAEAGVSYLPYVEPEPGAGRGLLAALAKNAVMVVGDDYPTFFLPRMVAAAAALPVRLELVDANGWLPMRVAERTFSRAHDFRRFLHRTLRPHLDVRPARRPLAQAPDGRFEIPADIRERWPAADLEALLAEGGLDALPIDQDVRPVRGTPGGPRAARERLDEFMDTQLGGYADRNDPDQDVGSRLSPYLHFGHLSSHEIVGRIFDAESFDAARLPEKSKGQREGWWGLSAAAEAFLDQVITWRELGFNMAHREPDHERFGTLPEWAQKTLAEHEDDPREVEYDDESFDAARTHDEIWNAAQRQLKRDGRIHNYLRMLWGKKILEWTPNARRAAEVMVHLNDRYALDGRDPNSYSGIYWVLGRYDRAWGPERPIYGKIRYMSSDNTRRKVKLKRYLERYGAR